MAEGRFVHSVVKAVVASVDRAAAINAHYKTLMRKRHSRLIECNTCGVCVSAKGITTNLPAEMNDTAVWCKTCLRVYYCGNAWCVRPAVLAVVTPCVNCKNPNVCVCTCKAPVTRCIVCQGVLCGTCLEETKFDDCACGWTMCEACDAARPLCAWCDVKPCPACGVHRCDPKNKKKQRLEWPSP
jgi:hypothetical protein